MSSNVAARRYARATRTHATVVTDDGPVRVRRQVGRRTAEHAAITASWRGADI